MYFHIIHGQRLYLGHNQKKRAQETMADPIKFCLLLFIFVALFPLGYPQSLDYVPICERTTMGNLCIEVIGRSISDKLKTTPIGHLTILKDKVKSFLLTTQTQIADNLRKINITSRAKYCLDTCSYQYSQAISLLEELNWNDLDNHNYPDHMATLEKVLDAVNTCTNVFSHPPIPTPSPINVYNEDTRKLIEVTLQYLNLNICLKITACSL